MAPVDGRKVRTKTMFSTILAVLFTIKILFLFDFSTEDALTCAIA